MLRPRLKSSILLLGLGLVASGCSDQKKPVPAVSPAENSSVSQPAAEAKPAALTTEPETSEQPKSPSETTKLEPTTPATETQQPTKPSAVAVTELRANPQAKAFSDAVYLPGKLVGLSVIHPKQYFESPIGKMLLELGIEQQSGEPAELLKRMKLTVTDVDRITIAIEQSLVDGFAAQNGLPVSQAGKPVDSAPAVPENSKIEFKNTLKQIGLAFHNYHDVFKRFPRANGDGEGRNTGLSWRVHLLPFLDQAGLYNQFHMDEAWDSEHNKQLIEKMPGIFRSPGVEDDTKTAFHVFIGEKTLFDGEKGIGIREISDGTSNTILAVLAAPETAEVWTKPGGLEVDLSSPRKALGDLKGAAFMTLFSDGFVRELPANIDEALLANLIQRADGTPISIQDLDAGKNDSEFRPITLPPTIVTLNRNVDRSDIGTGLLGNPQEETHEGQAFHKNETMAVWMPDEKTIIVGSIESVKAMMTTKQSGKISDSPLISQLQLAADVTFAVDLESQSALTGFAAQVNPMMGMITNIKTVGGQFSVTANEGEPLAQIEFTALDADKANALFAIANIGLNQGKMGVSQLPDPPNPSPADQEMQKLIRQLVASTTVTQEQEKIRLTVPTPKGFERVPELLKPAFLSARTAAQEAQQRNSMKMIGLSFHNYHDAFAAFPGAGRSRADSPVGLSWRVHLLPYLDQAPLYNQFKLDEPWDSEHNKALIDKMPALFKSPGVDEVGKTSIHVFTGPGSPFADDAAPSIRQFTDGTSNTILAVLAGPDTADIWTKPGGLNFDPDQPTKSLGNLIGSTFVALLADGSVRNIDKQIDDTMLRRMVQFQDGEPVQ